MKPAARSSLVSRLRLALGSAVLAGETERVWRRGGCGVPRARATSYGAASLRPDSNSSMRSPLGPVTSTEREPPSSVG